jgi:hypothetical protein
MCWLTPELVTAFKPIAWAFALSIVGFGVAKYGHYWL